MRKIVKITAIVSLLYFSLGVSAQNSTHTIGIFFTPQANIVDFNSNGVLGEIKKVKSNGISLSEGIFYQVEYNDMGFLVGLGYMKMNVTISYIAKSECGRRSYMLISNTKNKSFLSVPVSFFYDFYNKENYSIGANVGLSVDYLLRERKLLSDAKTPTFDPRSSKFIDKINASAFIGIDMKWTFPNGLGFSLTPTCSYIFTNTLPTERQMKREKTKGVEERYVNIGLSGKLFYTFK